MLNTHPPLPRDEANTIKKAISKIQFEKVEHLYIFKNGKQLRRFIGETNRVVPETKYLLELKDATVIHNHPQGTSFSLEDFQAILKFNAQKLILVTPNYCFIVERPASNWPISFDNSFFELFNSCTLLAEDLLFKEISKNEISNFDADVEKMHYIWSSFFTFLGIKYEKSRI
jgi:hypothetical protein